MRAVGSVTEGMRGNWCARERRERGEGNGALSEDERAELRRLRKESSKVAMQRCCDQAIIGLLGW
jgi:hypothetical protein